MKKVLMIFRFVLQPLRNQSPPRKTSTNSHRGNPQKQKKKKPSRSALSDSQLNDSTAREKEEVTMMSPPAMENLYYIAHSAVDALEIRGFGWESGGPKKKKKRKGRKGRKK